MKCFKCGKELDPAKGPVFRVTFPDYPDGYMCLACRPDEMEPGMIDKLQSIRDSLNGRGE